MPFRFCTDLAPVLAGLALLFMVGCASPRVEDGQAGDGRPAADADGWQVLFDGTDLSAWRGYGSEAVPSGWRTEGGALRYAPGGEGGDLTTREEFGDFELALEWRISPCGNSGIFYRGDPGGEGVWASAPEMQVLDDACNEDGRYPSHRSGSNYDLHAATPGAVRPAGEWNAARIVARGPHVEHWLNGQKVAEYEQGSDAWRARVATSKFRTWDHYGTRMRGVIALQDHGDDVWYRDIRVRRLDP